MGYFKTLQWLSRIVWCTALLGWLGGCAQPTVSTYVLDARIAPRPLAGAASGGVLLVATPQAEPGFDTPLIAYTKTPYALDYYTKSAWVDSPARMLAPLVVNALDSTQAFSAVLPLPTPANGDLRLDLNIIRLQQEFLEKPSRVRLTVRAKLIDTATHQVLGTRGFEAVEPAPSDDAYGGVQAANRAVARVLEELVGFVLQVAPQRNRRVARTAGAPY